MRAWGTIRPAAVCSFFSAIINETQGGGWKWQFLYTVDAFLYGFLGSCVKDFDI
jgi:hypothetical protein